jgi:hypothetical protein
MSATKKMPSLSQFKAWMNTTGQPLCDAVLRAQQWAKHERQRVNAYILPIFAHYDFRRDIRGEKGERIADPNLMYLSRDEEQAQRYYAECDTAHRAHGFTGPDGHCPALIAESEQVDAEQRLLAAAAEILGFDCRYLAGNKRARMLDLLLEAAAERMKPY